jgi:hypothetical protein
MALVATALVAVIAALYAILTAPYRLMRRARHTVATDRGAHLAPVRSTGAAA